MYAEYSKIIKFNELADPMDHWELIEKVGEGTYGEVHMAKHKELGKLCVCVCVCVCDWKRYEEEKKLRGLHREDWKGEKLRSPHG